MKQGFGLIEVLAAAVILGFMLIGLNTLQKGNRDSIIRIRARDVANTIAQDIIDSISAIGSASVPVGFKEACNPGNDTFSLCRERVFEGLIGTPKVIYSAVVDVTEDPNQVVNEQTNFLTALNNSGSGSGNMDDISLEHKFAKRVEVTVNWKFKESDQSINVSTVIR